MAMARILVVDDEPAVRSSVQRALQLKGYEVATASDGEEALSAVEDQRPDAIVLDVMMPHVDGLEVARRLRAAGVTTPILMLTARARVADRVAGLDAGADDYLVKPFALAELLARLRALLRRTTLDEGAETLRVRGPRRSTRRRARVTRGGAGRSSSRRPSSRCSSC